MSAARRAKKAHEVVAEQLRQQIVSGELAEGDRLPPEEELTEHYGIARTTLREALRVLESQGLVSIKRGRGGGPIVTHPNLEPVAMALAVSLQLQHTTMGDLDSARRLIEPQIAGQLARIHDDDDVEALRSAIDLASEAAERNDGQAFGLAAAHVHATLVERSGNRTLATISALLQNMVRAYYTVHMDTVEQDLMRRAVRSYERLLGYIKDGNEDAAVAHWEATMQYTIHARNSDEWVTIAAGGA